MDSDEPTPGQAEILSRGLFRGLNYLVRLRTRMEKADFRPDDPLYLLVCNAYDSAHRLSVDLHYRSCGHGVGRKSRKDAPP